MLFPYLNGEDLVTRPDLTASRWVINFHNWSCERAGAYVECFDQVTRLVKPERQKNGIKSRREKWWQYAEYGSGLIKALSGLQETIVMTLVSKVVMPAIVPAGQVFSHGLAVFPTDCRATFAVLSGSIHFYWALARMSNLATTLRYTPTNVFNTLVLPGLRSRNETNYSLDRRIV